MAASKIVKASRGDKEREIERENDNMTMIKMDVFEVGLTCVTCTNRKVKSINKICALSQQQQHPKLLGPTPSPSPPSTVPLLKWQRNIFKEAHHKCKNNQLTSQLRRTKQKKQNRTEQNSTEKTIRQSE